MMRQSTGLTTSKRLDGHTKEEDSTLTDLAFIIVCLFFLFLVLVSFSLFLKITAEEIY